MTRTFADDRADDLENAFHDPTEFGEAVTYVPKGGPSRSINVLVIGNSSTPDNEVGLMEGAQLRVQCRRHAQLGIDAPQLGDSIQRAGDPLAYAFSGQIEGVSAVAWTLTFARSKPIQFGGTHQERTA